MSDLRERLGEVSINIYDASEGVHEKAVHLDDAYRIAMEFAREESLAAWTLYSVINKTFSEWWSQRHPNNKGE